MNRLALTLTLLLGAFVLSTACESEPSTPHVPFVENVLAGATFTSADSLPRIQFADGLVSLNDRCPVRKVRLNLRLPPVYVNRHPVGFC